VATAASTRLDLDADEEESGDGLDLALPDFPLPPKRDRGFLHMPNDAAEGAAEGADDEAEVETAFDASAAPRFISSREGEDEEEEQEEEGQDEEEDNEHEQDEQEADDQDNDIERGEENFNSAPQTASFQPRYYARAGSAATAPVPFSPINQNFGADMRFASDMSRRYDTNTLPPNVPPTVVSAAAAAPTSIGDALFQPLHNSERQFSGAAPSPSLAADTNNYAWSVARPASAYAYGSPPPVGGTPVGWDPLSRASASSIRSAPSDLYQSEYRAFSANPWPSTVSPPSQYYLPPDIVLAR